MTMDELRREIKTVRNRIRCVLSDQERDPRRVYDEHRRCVVPMLQELWRLEHRYNNSEQIAAALEEQIAIKEAELRKCLNAPSVKKMLRLIQRLNELTTGRKKHRHSKLARMESELSTDRATTLAYIITGYRNEIRALQQKKSMEERMAQLRSGVNTSERYFWQFIENWTNCEKVLEAEYTKLDSLLAEEKRGAGERKVEKLNDRAQELMKLMLSMPIELVKQVLDEKFK